ncbi:MAG: T9SS type A sorting domain-containing protein [Chitinophagaceae bacterium]
MTKSLLKILFTFGFATTLIHAGASVYGRGGFCVDSMAATYPYDDTGENKKLVTRYYPNPARDYITFEFDKKLENNCVLNIYSFTGRKMTELRISNLKMTVNLADYFRGLYLFQLVSPKGHILESGKFQVLK